MCCACQHSTTVELDKVKELNLLEELYAINPGIKESERSGFCKIGPYAEQALVMGFVT